MLGQCLVSSHDGSLCMEAPERKEIAAQTAVCLRHEGSFDEIGDVHRRLLRWAEANGVQVAGKGFTVFITPPDPRAPERARYEVCLPAASAPAPEGEIEVKELPAITVAATVVKGPYSEISKRYTEMLAWLSAEDMDIDGPPREVYLRRPAADGSGDPGDFLTEIQIPIRA